MIRNVITLLLMVVGGLLDLAGQSAVSWHRTPEHRDGIVRYFAVASDSVIWCADRYGVFRVDVNGSRSTAAYRYYSKGLFSSILVTGSTILLVDVTDAWQNNALIRSSDDGLTWDTVNIERPDLVPVLLRSDEDGQLFLGCSNATMLTSLDSGKTWETFAEFEQIQNHRQLVPVSVSRKGEEFYCSVVDLSRKLGGAVNRYYRRDTTGKWSNISIEGQSGGTGTAEWEVGSIDWSVLYGTYFDHTFDARFRVSYDHGESWQEPWSEKLSLPDWSYGPGSIVNAAGDVFVCRKTSDNSHAVSVSRDSGKSFVDVIQDGVVATFSRGSDGRIWILAGRPTIRPAFTLWREDASLSELEPVLNEADLEFEYPISGRTVKKLAVQRWGRWGYWYAIVDGAGVWHTSDRGKIWKPVIPTVRSDWDRLTDIETYEPTESVYLGGPDGIDRMSSGFSVMWESITSQINVAAFRVARDRGIIAETVDGRIVRVDDDGSTEEVGPDAGDSAVRGRLLHVDLFWRAYVSGSDGIFYLPVASPEWESIPLPKTIEPEEIRSLCVADQNTLALATNRGVLISTNFGVTWRDWGVGTREVEHILATTGRNVETGIYEPVFLAVAGDSIWHTTNLGVSWVNINGDLPAGKITAIVVDSAAGCIVVAVKGEGVFWSSTPSVTRIDEIDPVEDEILAFALQRDGGVRISIGGNHYPDVWVYDLLGRPVLGDVVWSSHGNRYTGIWSPRGSCPTLLFVRVSRTGSSDVYHRKLVLPRVSQK